MAIRNRKISKVVEVDSFRERGLGEKGSVLLFDESIGAYYVTTLPEILSYVLAKQKEDLIKLRAEFEALKKSQQEQMAGMQAEQKKFIAETAKVNQTIINLVKGETT